MPEWQKQWFKQYFLAERERRALELVRRLHEFALWQTGGGGNVGRPGKTASGVGHQIALRLSETMFISIEEAEEVHRRYHVSLPCQFHNDERKKEKAEEPR